MPKKIKNILNIFLPLFLGGVISFIIRNKINYAALVKPPLSPPRILFIIMWTIIYFLMGISYYIRNKNDNIPFFEKIIYYIQLIINLLWALIFFYCKNYLIASIWILFLDVLVLIMILLFWKKERISSLLNLPYFLWILFATYLTIGIYLLN